MDIHVATLCDSAVDYNGKLCVLGTFDQIISRSAPIVHPQCALALRVCFKSADEGVHKLGVHFIDADGKAVFPPFEPQIEVRLPADGDFITRNIVLNLQGLKFEQPGLYSVEITFDDQTYSSIPLRVRVADAPAA